MSEIFCNFASVSVNSMKKIVYVALLCSLLSVFTGCDTGSSPSHVDARRAALSVMTKADSLMRTRPDSALKLLYSLTPEGKPFPLGEGWGEAYYLLLLDAQNKCDTVFRSDTLQRALVSYYDRHGTPNERMRAYYLLGRACHDMGEAPRALDCYQQAIDCADTTSTDCDYYTLSAVYGQMSSLFHRQFLAEDELKAQVAAEKYSWKTKDTLRALEDYELRFRPYYLKGEKDSVLAILYSAQEKYRKHGYIESAARASLAIIAILLEREDYSKVGKYIEVYEHESGLFDKDGNIEKGREIYYYYKGCYLQGTGKLSEAEIYYRRALYHGYDEAAYKGLLSVYRERNIPDSMAKYSQLYAEANDKGFMETNAEVVHQTSALYDYSRYQQLSEKNAAKLAKGRLLNTYILFGLLILLALLVFLYNKVRKRTRRRVTMLAQNYLEAQREKEEAKQNLKLLSYQHAEDIKSLEKQIDSLQKNIEENEKRKDILAIDNSRKMIELKKLQDTISKAKEDYSVKVATQNEEIRRLKLQVKFFKGQIDREKNDTMLIAFRKTSIYETISKHNLFKKQYNRIKESEWKILKRFFCQYFPEYDDFIRQDAILTENEIRVCMLHRIGFSPKAIANLMEKKQSSITNFRSNINRKLFFEEGAATFDDNMKPFYTGVVENSQKKN